MNAGIAFHTPEQFFLGADPLALDPLFCPGLDPRTVARCAGSPYDSIRVPEQSEQVQRLSQYKSTCLLVQKYKY
jgi:hypothetical protein